MTLLTMTRLAFVRRIGEGLPGMPLTKAPLGPPLPAGHPALPCWECEKAYGGPRSHAPRPPEDCPGCGQEYVYGCKYEHHHDGWAGCFDSSDIRQFECGCFGHKECVKGGEQCRVHGEVPA
jgi:hypothetical protein